MNALKIMPSFLSLAGAAKSTIFVATNTCSSRQDTSFVVTKVCLPGQIFVPTKLCLSRQNNFVVTKVLAYLQVYLQVYLQAYLRQMFFATNVFRDKNFVATNTCGLSRQK